MFSSQLSTLDPMLHRASGTRAAGPIGQTPTAEPTVDQAEDIYREDTTREK